MNWTEWVRWILCILTGIAAAIPLVIRLVNAIKELEYKDVMKKIEDGQFAEILLRMTKYMKQAETRFDDGDVKKEWVMLAVEALADELEYTLTDEDRSALGDMVDAICDAAKVVNTPAK